MSIRSLIDPMYEEPPKLSSEFLEFLDEYFQETKRVEDKKFPTADAEYTEGKAVLERILNDDQKAILAEIEKSWHENVKWVASFGFFAGNHVKRKEAVSADMEKLFDEFIIKEVLTVPGMLKYPKYYAKHQYTLKLSNFLESRLDEEAKEHLVSVDCAWEQELYSVLRKMFSIGLEVAKIR